jgi:hypothetical protein
LVSDKTRAMRGMLYETTTKNYMISTISVS